MSEEQRREIDFLTAVAGMYDKRLLALESKADAVMADIARLLDAQTEAEADDDRAELLAMLKRFAGAARS